MKALVRMAYMNLAIAVICKNNGDIITANTLTISAVNCLNTARKMCP